MGGLRNTFWIVKGDPHRNDFSTLLPSRRQQTWVTRKPPKDWRAGDRVLMWASSPAKCLVGMAEIVRIAQPQHGVTEFSLKYASTTFETPLGIDLLRRDTALRDASFLKAGPASTVFRLSTPVMKRLLTLVAKHNVNHRRKAHSWLRRIDLNERGSGLRALSVKPPYAQAIIVGEKDVENRSWAPPERVIGSWIAIHASGNLREDDVRDCQSLAPNVRALRSEQLPRFAIIGVARVASYSRTSKSRWYNAGSIAWNIDDVVAIRKPIPVKGKLGLWRVPTSLEAELRAQLPKRVRLD